MTKPRRKPVVHKFVQRYQISPSLVFAIIRAESNFNPFAVSSAPAYGLMQLVPTSGGREAYRPAKGKDVTPSREYLFDPTNNVEFGTAYLSVLTFDQLDEVVNLLSREYCVISAYNTGPRNVFRAFSKDATAAVTQINGLQPGAVYEHLRQHLPYQETHHYPEKGDCVPQSVRELIRDCGPITSNYMQDPQPAFGHAVASEPRPMSDRKCPCSTKRPVSERARGESPSR